MRLAQLIAAYWLARQIDLSPATRADYSVTFGRLGDFLGDPVFTDITADDLRRFLAHVQQTYSLGRKTVTNYWIALSSLWTWAETEFDCKHIMRNRVKRPKFQTREIEPLESSEIAAMIDAAKTRRTGVRDTAIILTLLDSGLRAQEICSLQVRDYDKLRGRLHVRHGKNDKPRFVPLGQRSQQAINDHLATRGKPKQIDPLFATRTGTHLERNNLGNLLEAIAGRAGVAGANPHRWRHTYAINFLRSGGNALLLQKILGHSSLEMTTRYVRFIEHDITDAGQFSPVDRLLT